MAVRCSRVFVYRLRLSTPCGPVGVGAGHDVTWGCVDVS
jgi:hypothetical protein